MRTRILFLALALTLTQTPAVEANKHTKSTSAPAIGPTGGYIYKYVAGKQQRKDITGKWQKRDQRSESSFDPIRVAAYKSICSQARRTDSSNSGIVRIASEVAFTRITNAIKSSNGEL